MTTGRINQVTILTPFLRWEGATLWRHTALTARSLRVEVFTVAHADPLRPVTYGSESRGHRHKKCRDPYGSHPIASSELLLLVVRHG